MTEMTLATRCPACLTSFLVVKDQLRQAEGWVRCGRCDEVFLATDAMTAVTQVAVATPERPVPDQMAKVSAGPPEQTEAPPAPTADSAVHVEERLEDGEPDRVETHSEAFSDAPPEETLADNAGQCAADPAPPAALPEPVPTPSAQAHRYVWDTATRATTPRSPWAAAWWAVVAAAGVAGLGAQAALAWHDELAQAAPVLKPALEVVCVMADCKLEPLRQLQALSVEASQISLLGGTIYQVNTTIRNRAAVELAAPALDLVLTGSDGQVLARKVLRWADFGLRSRSMAAQQELSLQTQINTGTTAVAGFTIELFYP